MLAVKHQLRSPRPDKAVLRNDMMVSPTMRNLPQNVVNNAVDVSHTLEVILSGKVYPAKE